MGMNSAFLKETRFYASGQMATKKTAEWMKQLLLRTKGLPQQLAEKKAAWTENKLETKRLFARTRAYSKSIKREEQLTARHASKPDNAVLKEKLAAATEKRTVLAQALVGKYCFMKKGDGYFEIILAEPHRSRFADEMHYEISSGTYTVLNTREENIKSLTKAIAIAEWVVTVALAIVSSISKRIEESWALPYFGIFFFLSTYSLLVKVKIEEKFEAKVNRALNLLKDAIIKVKSLANSQNENGATQG